MNCNCRSSRDSSLQAARSIALHCTAHYLADSAQPAVDPRKRWGASSSTVPIVCGLLLEARGEHECKQETI